MLLIKRLMFVCFCLVSCDIALADIVKWVDENGKVHFGDRVPEKYKDQVETVDVSGANVVENNNRSKPAKKKRKSVNNTANKPANNQKSTTSAQQCKVWAQKYKNWTTVTHSGERYGTKTITSYPLKKDGSIPTQQELNHLKDSDLMSRLEQNRYAERLRKKWNRRGCSIQQTPKLRL